MDQSHGQTGEIPLVAQAHAVQIVTRTIAETFRSLKGNEAAEIVCQTREPHCQRSDQQQVVGGMSDDTIGREKIREEQLIDGERERFEVELAKPSLVTSRTNAQHVAVVSSLQAASVGEASIALVTSVIVVEAFRLHMLLVTDAQVDAVEEA